MSARSGGAKAPAPGAKGPPGSRQVARAEPRASATGRGAARAAFGVGLLYVAVSVYWGLGGTWLLDTIGGSLEKLGRAGNTSVILAVWAAAGLKLVAAVLPLLAVRRLVKPAWHRAARMLTWIQAAVLTIYGLVLTAAGLLVQASVLRAQAYADHRALAWHAYLWDPWFLIWGVLTVGALRRSRRLS